MCNIVHTCIKKYTVAVLYSCKFYTARVLLFLADHEAKQFTNILKIRRYLCADEAKGLLVPYVLVAVRRVRGTIILEITVPIPYWITTDRSVVQPTKKHLQCTPVQLAYGVFNRDQSVRDGQFICILRGVISFLTS